MHSLGFHAAKENSFFVYYRRIIVMRYVKYAVFTADCRVNETLKPRLC